MEDDPTTWQPIETAPTDGTLVRVWVAPDYELPGFETVTYYHPEGGWCVDEVREATYWKPVDGG